MLTTEPSSLFTSVACYAVAYGALPLIQRVSSFVRGWCLQRKPSPLLNAKVVQLESPVKPQAAVKEDTNTRIFTVKRVESRDECQLLCRVLNAWNAKKHGVANLLKERIENDDGKFYTAFQIHYAVDEKGDVQSVMSTYHHKDGKSIYIDYIVSNPEKRAKGAGASLIGQAIVRGIEKGGSLQAACIRVKALTAAVPFFSHLGFSVTNEGRMLHGETLSASFNKIQGYLKSPLHLKT